MSDNIQDFPISFSQRRKNKLGPLHVECKVSDRYLRFREKSSTLQDGEYIIIDVMTTQTDINKPYKLCEVIITREDLLEALNHISPKK